MRGKTESGLLGVCYPTKMRGRTSDKVRKGRLVKKIRFRVGTGKKGKIPVYLQEESRVMFRNRKKGKGRLIKFPRRKSGGQKGGFVLTPYVGKSLLTRKRKTHKNGVWGPRIEARKGGGSPLTH